MAKTQNFGLEKFGTEGRISDNGHKFSLRDRESIDSLFYSLFNHDHRQIAVLDVVAPTQAPLLTHSSTGGTLPANTDYYYTISYRDSNGNETEVTASAYIATPPKVITPPVLLVSTADTGGTLAAGTYRYALAHYQTAGGQTKAPNETSVYAATGSTNVNTITLNTLPDDADGWKVFRKAPSEDAFFLLDTIVGATAEYDDDGTQNPDCTKKRLSTNTTNATNSIVVDIDPIDLPLNTSVAAWRLYRTSFVGAYGSSSLRSTVTETVTENGADLVTTFTDTGGALSPGTPITQTTIPPKIPQLDAGDVFDLDNSAPLPAKLAPRGGRQFYTFMPSTLAAQDYAQVYLPHDMHAERIDAFFLTAPTGLTPSTDYLTLRFSDDSLVDEIQSVYHDAETQNEFQTVYTTATGGDFTLSFDGQGPTGDIPFDADGSDLKTELELLSNITTVFVAGGGTAANPWVVEFQDPGASDVVQMTANSAGLTGGTATVSTSLAGSDGGTFTLSDGTDTTSAIDYDATTGTIETRLETDITAYTDVSVSGAGSQADPWLVTFVNPGDQDIEIMISDDTSLNGTMVVAEVTRGRSNSQIDLVIDQNQQYHFWQSSTTDYGEAEAEDETGGTEVSDVLATNDVAMELDTQTETNEWNPGYLEAGEYIARFFVSDVEKTASVKCTVEDRDGAPATMETETYTDGQTVYIPSHDIEFTATGAEDVWFVVEKDDTGSDAVRVDKYEYEVVLPRLYGGQTVKVECLVTGTPSTNGEDCQVTLWY